MKSQILFCLTLVLSGSLCGCSTAVRNPLGVQPTKVSSVPKVELKFVSVDSQETNAENGYGKNAVDGNPNTIWHTQWYDKSPGFPHKIVIELVPPSFIKGFTYLPRQDESDHGTIKDFEFYVSNDGKHWGQPVKAGTFGPGKGEKIETFKPVKCRFVKLEAISEIHGLPWTSAAEIGVIPVGENVDLLTNPIYQAKALLAEFKKTKSLDQLEKAYMAIGNIPEPGVDEKVPKAVARRELARTYFSLLAVIHQNIDTNFDVNNPANWPLMSIVPPVMPKGVPDFSGMDPKDIKNPKDRALYEAAIQANEKKGARLNFQVRLRNMDRLATLDVEMILRHDYTTSKKDQNELEDLMKQAKLSPAQIQKIMARFDNRDNKMP